MQYLLDTNVVVAILRDRPSGVRRRLRTALRRKVDLLISTITLYELWHGVARSSRPDANAEQLRILLSGDLRVIDFTHDDARIAGELRARLESKGASIGPYDLLIASQALRHSATLVTANAREFDRVPRLRSQDWTRRSRPAAG